MEMGGEAPSHRRRQLLHVGVDVAQQAVALLEERVLRVHEGQHLRGRRKQR